MKILSLNVQNFLRIEALEIIPKGNSVTITGKNDQGKSSTLRALDVALGGGKTPAEPIRRGANKGKIIVELGRDKVEAIVEKTYVKRDGKDELATLTVSTPEGARYPKPQEFLDKILGSLSLDPVKFLDMKPEEQAAAVRHFVKGFDFAAADASNKKDYADRTEVNREVKRLTAEISTLPKFEENWPTELVETAELITQIESAAAANAAIERASFSISQMQDGIVRLDKEAGTLDETLTELQTKLQRTQALSEDVKRQKAEAEGKLAQARQLYADMTPVDVEAVREQLTKAERVNDDVREYKQAETRRGRLQSELDDKTTAAFKLTTAMDARKAEAAQAISKAEMPVAGLGFDDDGMLTINDFAFANTAFSKRLMAAIAIAAAHAPELRLIKISEGDKLDDDAQAALAQFAIDHDLQIWQETVQHGAPVGFVIEDGKLKEYAE